MEVIIPRNTTIPTKKSKTITTHADNQQEFLIKFYEGESKINKDNLKLGQFNF